MGVGMVRLVLLSVTPIFGGCGTANIESDRREKHHEIVSKGAVVLAGATVAACLLIPKVRRACANIGDLNGAKNKAKKLELEQQRLRKEITRVQENSAVITAKLEQDIAGVDDYLKKMSGRQANINGIIHEINTVEALPKIIRDIYKGVTINKILRNVEGSYTQKNGKSKGFEIDAIAISDKLVFIIEAKTNLRHKHADALVKLLENFPKFEFNNLGLKNKLRDKKVHGGISFLQDSKLPPDNTMTTRTASKYARDKKQLLVIPRFSASMSSPNTLAKLRDFQGRG